MKNSAAQIRVHRYGIMTIWSISFVKGPDIHCRTNVFTVRTKEGEEDFYSKAAARSFINECINKAPDEFKDEFIQNRDIFSKVI